MPLLAAIVTRPLGPQQWWFRALVGKVSFCSAIKALRIFWVSVFALASTLAFAFAFALLVPLSVEHDPLIIVILGS